MVNSISNSHISSAQAAAQPAAKQTTAPQGAKGSALPQDKVSLSGQSQKPAAAKGNGDVDHDGDSH